MTETDTSREKVEAAFEAIREHIASLKAECDRHSYIAATIRVNAMKKGATDDQIEAFLTGEQSFIAWMVEQVEGVDSRALLARAEKAEAAFAKLSYDLGTMTMERNEAKADARAAWNDAIEASAKRTRQFLVNDTALPEPLIEEIVAGILALRREDTP